ncbi:bifunctional glycoside hydrolase 114/ polysaccharide deacetylase family protein [Actimicrobium sp. CCC2.4]|uniref:bifunctional glycoside hydrolase 114/ polysaccharide deacetylase family protein n=1 Tax=Actimicrobium sp. CCC2.4 TaxID=3048606 RepID=UPI002AC98F40|nr:bifunctional glycoside hydrolase 114/ polysaccharide deacetylase family protein [Actimicrobium sp. CCC2.4]MEB0134081.1 bifunctional glycoside hydrolase 114/ polysaccharide deacetylase family protein [Actimicrobium sp. CCC2.4]WPX31613.1 bifunctional glycoside hydrolase 114/ polysaccharide deacetylase family protein [Actimicrobium sp. CCC2.4]
MIVLFLPALALAAPPSVAFYYGAQAPLADLQAFDIAVVEPDFVSNPASRTRPTSDGAHALFAYVSLGEVQPSRSYYQALPAGALRGDNAAWGSKVIDQAAPGWNEFFLTSVIAPLWQQGWRGFFLDTLDSYQLFATTDAERTRQQEAMVALLREFKRRYPDARLILNRGFELLPEVAPLVFAVAAESLYQGYDAARKQYGPVPAADRTWLMAQMQTVRERYQLPVIAIDYVDPSVPGARALARSTARQLASDGFIPWVADGGLVSLGVGNIEVLPRTVLVLVDNLDLDFHYTSAQRFLGMPLNYLGLRYEFLDLATQPLPAGILAGRYAGIVSWLNPGVDHPTLANWMRQQIASGVRIAVFDTFGFVVEGKNAAALGVRRLAVPRPERLTVHARDTALLDFEVAALPDRSQLEPLQLLPQQGRSLLSLQDGTGNTFDAVALTAWGGFALSPFTTRSLSALDQDRWILQPIRFLQAALQLPDLPVPDVTTEGGRRMLMVHIDADGFPSRAELPGRPLAPEVLQKQILSRYRLPTAVSVIEAEISPQGVYPALSAELEPLARKIFALPYVEAASHSYSHPFSWARAMGVISPRDEIIAVDKSYGLPLPGYRFDLKREVQGSMDYINTRLMPPNKKAELFLWTGNCVPLASAIAETVKDGFLNMNGGDTRITASNNSWTAIAAQGVRKGGWYQVFAPNQNENVYTNNWTGPYYGFERVIETYQLTGAPYRFKPVDIYYHVYSATKPASIAALHKVYGWAVAQPFTRVFPSQYVRKVLDFEATSIARELASEDLLVRTGASLRTLRMPPGAAVPSLRDSSGVAGVATGPSGDYLTLSSAQVRLSARPDQGGVRVDQINGGISDFTRTREGAGEQLRFTATANEAITLTLAQAAGCRVSADGKPVAASGSDARYVLDGGDAMPQRRVITVRCAA